MEMAETEYECGSGVTCLRVIQTFMGGGIYVADGSPTLRNLVVTGNNLPGYSHESISDTVDRYTLSHGGGIFSTNGNLTMSILTVSQNSADAGGGFYMDAGSVASMAHSTIDANTASTGGGIGTEGSFSSTNCVFVNNSTTEDNGFGGAALDVGAGSSTLTNVTAVGNDGYAGTFVNSGASAEVRNSILAESAAPAPVVDTSGTLSFLYSDVHNSSGSTFGASMPDPTGTDGNISASAGFVAWSDDDDSSNDDFHLIATSPALDAGDPDPASNDSDGSPNDMGAYGGPDGTW
jgi:hypothetical protein